MIRILIVDDQNLVQQGIKSLLDRDMDFKVIGTVKDGRNAVQQIAQIHPDIVLLDIEMPGMDGITTTKYINRVSPKTKVIILSSHEEKKYVTQALMAGARGYILKSSLMTDLKQAILAVNNGYSQIDSRLLAKVFDPQSIRSKKTNLEEKSNNIQNPSKPLSHSPLKKAEIYESAILESDTQTQSETSTAWKSKEKTFSNVAADSVVLKQVNRKEEIAKLDRHQKLSSQTALKTIKRNPIEQKTFTKEHELGSFRSPKQRTVSIVEEVKRLLASPKIASDKSKANNFKSQLKQYKVKLLSLIQQKQKQNLFWNVILVIFGIVVVVILGS